MERADDRPDLSGAEREVLIELWEGGPATVRVVAQALEGRGKTWKYTTVLTLLQRLVGKGYAAADASGSAHVYRASATREEVVQTKLRDVADQYCDGATMPLVLNLVRAAQFSPAELAEFRALLDQMKG